MDAVHVQEHSLLEITKKEKGQSREIVKGGNINEYSIRSRKTSNKMISY